MTFEDCIRQGVTNNEITADQASEAIDLFTELREQYNKQLGPGPAASKAAIDAAEAVKRQAIQRKRRTLLQAQAWKQIKKDFSEYNLDARQATLNDLNEKLRSSTNPAEIKKLNEQIKDISTGDAANAALSLIEQDTISKYSSVVQLREAITRRTTGMMDQYLATFRRDIGGRTRNKAQLKNVVREIFGENTGDSAASEMAQAWKKASDYLRTRFQRSWRSNICPF
jgi:membrane-associated HD superfamily phosphohydrolase